MGAETGRERAGAAIRAFRQEDVAPVTRILERTPEAANWAAESYREALSWPGVLALVCETEGKVSGFIIARHVADEAEVLNLAVEPERRGKGEGGELLKKALEELRERGTRRVFLEVRESNETGIAFYTKRGFVKTGRREGYYREPEEAAVVMELKLTG